MKLLLRTTRRVTPTDAGAVFLERSRRILGDLDEAAHAARGVDSLHGLLRVVMSEAFGTREVIPRLPAFLDQHPRSRSSCASPIVRTISLPRVPISRCAWDRSPTRRSAPACWRRRRASSLPRRPISRDTAFRRRSPTCRRMIVSSGLA